MKPKHKLVTVIWCSLTMAGTMILSHGHLIMKEILRNWPEEDSWEGRFENALYTQGGLALLASVILSIAVVIRGYIARKQDEDIARRDRLQREQHMRADATRHEAMLDALEKLRGVAPEKKGSASGARPR